MAAVRPHMGFSLSAEELDHYSSLARRFARHWCNPSDAEDAAQDVLLRFIRQHERPRNDVTWFYVVTRRVCHRMQVRVAAQREAEESYGRSLVRLDADNAALDVASVLRALRARDRTILQMVWSGIPAREIAARLGCKTRDVGQLVARARAKARDVRDAKKVCTAVINPGRNGSSP